MDRGLHCAYLGANFGKSIRGSRRDCAFDFSMLEIFAVYLNCAEKILKLSNMSRIFLLASKYFFRTRHKNRLENMNAYLFQRCDFYIDFSGILKIYPNWPEELRVYLKYFHASFLRSLV